MGSYRLTDYGPLETRPAHRRAAYTPVQFALLTATVLVLVWGALAFGAVYPWAYKPLSVCAALTGLLALTVGRRGRPPFLVLATVLGCLGLAIALQLAPLPPTTVARVSPAAQPLEARYREGFGVLAPIAAESPAADGRQSLSIAPRRTAVGLFLFAAFALLCLGVSRLLSSTGARAIGKPLVGFGVALALFGILSSVLTAGVHDPLIYGFWKPQFSAHPFGPFVNPNHFAGWMLMAAPIALALFYDAFQRTIDEAKGSHGDGMAFVASPHFSGIMLYGLAAALMGVSLVMTRSRSGITALAAASTVIAWIVLRRQRGAKAKIAVFTSFLIVMIGTAAWAGLDTVADKFAVSGVSDTFIISGERDQQLGAQSGRLVAWKDTIRIIRDFPLTGTGFNTYGTAMTVYQSALRDVHFQEAHNDYLQIAAEGGLLVGVPALLVLMIFARDVRRRFRESPKEGTTYWLRVGAAIGLLAIGLQSLFEFSLQMPGNAALFAVLAAIALHQSPRLRTARTSQRPEVRSLQPGERSFRVLKSTQTSFPVDT
jgi:O-antigen ligase